LENKVTQIADENFVNISKRQLFAGVDSAEKNADAENLSGVSQSLHRIEYQLSLYESAKGWGIHENSGSYCLTLEKKTQQEEEYQ
jgi:hypothetical protein